MMQAATRPRGEDLGPGPEPAAVLAALAADPGEVGLACLWGSWLTGASSAGPTVLITAQPRAVSSDPGALDAQPPIVAPDPSSGVIGGGWIGWLGYDVPAHLAFYDHLLRWDDDTRRWRFEALWTRRRAAALRARREQLRTLLGSIASGAGAPSNAPPTGEFGEFAGPDRARHLAAVERAIELIRAGELYQVNVCTRLQAEFETTRAGAATLFAQAAVALRPRFGAFIDGGDRTVLSLSPELFVRRVGDQVTSSPIKGTWARDPGNPAEAGADRLRHSAKDVAENIMIVDLVRNDLGRVSRPGSVRVQQLLSVQPHPGVWHLVSTVAGRLRPSVGDGDLIAATFPPGSVTGAPKVRAQQAIAELEDQPRGVYTGAIGIAGPVSGLLLSVAIRTFEITPGRIELGVGGGITADSVPELEWRECVQKAAPLLRALGAPVAPAFGARSAVAAEPQPWQLAGGLIETILAVDGTVLRLADHLARLDRSARELYGFGIAPGLAAQVRHAAVGRPGRVAIRVVLDSGATVTVTAAPARPRPSTTAVRVRERGGVWRHKWADRSWLPADEGEPPAVADTLFIAPDATVLETTRGNVFVLDAAGVLMTPPLRDDLLPGVTRRAVLDLARDRGWPVRLQSFPVEALIEAAAVFWTSSLSAVVPITSVDGRPLAISAPAGDRLESIAIELGRDGWRPVSA